MGPARGGQCLWSVLALATLWSGLCRLRERVHRTRMVECRRVAGLATRAVARFAAVSDDECPLLSTCLDQATESSRSIRSVGRPALIGEGSYSRRPEGILTARHETVAPIHIPHKRIHRNPYYVHVDDEGISKHPGSA